MSESEPPRRPGKNIRIRNTTAEKTGAIDDRRSLGDHLNNPLTPEEEFKLQLKTFIYEAGDVASQLIDEGDKESAEVFELFSRNARLIFPQGGKDSPSPSPES